MKADEPSDPLAIAQRVIDKDCNANPGPTLELNDESFIEIKRRYIECLRNDTLDPGRGAEMALQFEYFSEHRTGCGSVVDMAIQFEYFLEDHASYPAGSVVPSPPPPPPEHSSDVIDQVNQVAADI
eukprot:2531365-Prymnesium_polylepis.1